MREPTSTSERRNKVVSVSLRRRIVFATTTLCVGALLCAVAAEGVLRATGWKQPDYYDLTGRPLPTREPGREGGAYTPGVGTLYHWDFEVPWKINRHGFRERELAPKAPGVWRVGVLGDSMAAGYGVLRDERFADLWFTAMQGEMPEAELWNLSASGAGTAHLADILAGVGQQYELDEIVLVLFGGNELGDNLRWRRTQTAESEPEPEERRSGVRRLLRRHSRLAAFLWVNGIAGIMNLVAPIEEPPASFFAEAWPETEKALQRMRRAAGRRPLTVWYLPSRLEWDEPFWQAASARQAYTDADRTQMRDKVRGWAAANDVRFLDATPWLRGQPVSKVKFPIDGHWTTHGHRLVADGLVAHGAAARGLDDAMRQASVSSSPQSP